MVYGLVLKKKPGDTKTKGFDTNINVREEENVEMRSLESPDFSRDENQEEINLFRIHKKPKHMLYQQNRTISPLRNQNSYQNLMKTTMKPKCYEERLDDVSSDEQNERV